jgi:ATP-dependent DNA helicase RecG
MLRLIQGDVGAGKTVVAALAALQALEAGYQVALMAPTEILAEQHFLNFTRWLEPLGIETAWLAGKLKGKARAASLQRIADGAAMVVGTHALFQDEVQFRNLALVIIDEQHRFGVQQRLALRKKGVGGSMCPHQLIMTATPIPRTLAMSAYADLDTSILDELPPGRTPVNTVLVADSRRVEVVERVRNACAEGRQAYWVCTLIEESEELTCQAAETTFEELTSALDELKVGLIHGRMKPVEKAAVMAQFKQGDLQLLVATTVIEVGVDVPNASLMIIENPERLGLAQLHQLRGRVGRGSAASHCVLLYHPPLSQIGRQRLGIMRETNDGFVIAEKDLELRGPGEMLGTRQTGLLQFKVADLMRDADLLPAVRDAAQALLERWPQHVSPLLERWLRHGQQYGQV